MKLEHRFTVPASVEETWAAFNDLERVVPCFPGATLSSFDGDEFIGSCKVKLGPISLVYNGSGRFIERDEAVRRAVLEAKGKDKRGNGTATATVTAQLSGTDPSATSVIVETDLSITGKPAQFGRGVMQDVSDKMLATFVECLQTKLGPDEPVSEESAPDEPEGSATEALAVGAPTAEAPAPPGAEMPPPEPVATTPSKGAPGVADTAAPRREDDPTPAASLDLGATVLPVLARRYGPYLAGLLVLLLVVRRLLR